MILMSLATSYAHADYYEWNGNTSSNIEDQSNWGEMQGSDVIEGYVINTQSPNMPIWTVNESGDMQYPHGGASNNFYIGTESGSTGKLTIIKPMDKYLYGSFNIGHNGGTGELLIEIAPPLSETRYGNPLTIDAYYEKFAIGTGSNSQGTLTIKGDGFSTSRQKPYDHDVMIRSYEGMEIGAHGGQGAINVDGTGLMVGYSDILLGSGANSIGELNILGGGKFTHGESSAVGTLRVGHNGGQGSILVSSKSASGDISRIKANSGLTVGDGNNSLGQVLVSQGGQMITHTSDSSYDPNTSESVTFYHQVGVNGGTGKVTIDGTGSSWTILGENYGDGRLPEPESASAGELFVGKSGAGEVALSNGGKLSIGTGGFTYAYSEDGNNYWYAFDESTYIANGTLYLGTESTGTGTLSIGGALGQAAQGVGVLEAAAIEFGEGTGTLHFNHIDMSGTYEFNTALISGTGSSNILHSNGVTLFNSDQDQFTGKTTITGGHLIANAQLGGSVDINTQGTLGGTGHVGDVVVGNGGTVRPGAYNENRLSPASFATLSADSITFNSGSRLFIQGNPTGEIDVLKATTTNGGTGTVTLNSGSELYIQGGAGTWAEETKYIFMQADGGITGEFTTVNSNLAFLTSQVAYNADEAYLYLTRNNVALGDIGITYNQIQTGYGINSLGAGNSVYDTIVSMSADQANASYNNLSGEIHANVKGALLSNLRYSRSAVNNHLGGLNTNGLAPEQNLWVDAWGHTGTIEDDNNASKIDTSGYGVLVGWDAYQNGTTTLGIAAGYEHNSMDSDNIRDSKANTDALHLMLYGATSIGEIDLRAGIDYAVLDVSTEREVNVAGLEGKHDADYKGNMLQAFVEGSHTFKISEQFNVTPYAGIAFQQVRTNSATETGGNAATALRYHGGTDYLTTGTIGVRGQWQLSDKAQLYGHAGWQSNLGSHMPKAALNFAGGSIYNQKGASLNSNSAVVGFGTKIKTGSRSLVRIGYDGEFGSNNKGHAAHVQWEMRF
ncbi:MAG: autotransporter outer membrane beta-barrel domain-containing protein [Saezia sp.]